MDESRQCELTAMPRPQWQEEPDAYLGWIARATCPLRQNLSADNMLVRRDSAIVKQSVSTSSGEGKNLRHVQRKRAIAIVSYDTLIQCFLNIHTLHQNKRFIHIVV